MCVVVLGNYMNAHFIHVDRLPGAGESLAARRVFQEHGGKGFNLGVGLHRLGVPVRMLMAVGTDEAGASVLTALRQEGMDTSCMHELGDRSGFGVGFIAPDGSNFLAAHLGANALLTPDHLHALLHAQPRPEWVLGHLEAPVALVRRAFELAREMGAKTYLNASPWQSLDPATLALVDVLVVNETEATAFFCLNSPPVWTRREWADRLPQLCRSVGWAGDTLVLTLGADGSLSLDAAGCIREATAPTIRQVDATGAGDAFGCGLVCALMLGATLDEALAAGNACGAHVAAREGIFAHLPRLDEVPLLTALAEARAPAGISPT